MPRISHLIGTWFDSTIGKSFHVRKALDTSNTYLSIEFSTEMQYLEPFPISSKFFLEDQWHRFNPKSFEGLILQWNLKKLEIVI